MNWKQLSQILMSCMESLIGHVNNVLYLLPFLLFVLLPLEKVNDGSDNQVGYLEGFR